MANNYFGFPTHGGAQYSAQATNYPAAAAQGTYVHQAPHTAAYPTATPRQQTGYDTYQTTHTTPGQYAYTATARQPAVAAVKPAAAHVATTPASYQDTSSYYARTTHAATPSYDSSKTYYQPATQTPAYSATSSDSHYQSSAGKYTASTKPAYSTNTGYSATPQRAATAQKVPASSSNYVYQSTQPSANYSSANTYVTTTASSYSGYDAALYNAATSYYQQQQTGTSAVKTSAGTWNKNKTAGGLMHNKPKPKAPPQTMQLHYCDVCKISCAGPQTYREHLEGSKHKKKEAAAQPRGGQNQLWCELCNVTCTGSDAYVAHLKGAKHMKVVKLHTLLGKSIPSSEPVLISTTGPGTSTTTTKASGTSTAAATKTTTTSKTVPSTAAATATVKKVLATPKITFVGGSQLKTAGTKEEVKVEPMQAKETEEEKEERRTVSLASLQENETQPVGHEYIEEVKNEAGKIISFQCKLCECKFNDPNAKEMHLKGRRHRLQYKKKVDPYLQVEVKPSIRLRKAQEEKLRRIAQKEEYWKRKDMEEHRLREEMRCDGVFEELEAMQWQGGRPPMGHQGFPRPMMPMRRPDSSDDRHVMAKHASIYPTDAELQAVQNIVSSCEKALKLVSDHIAEVDAPKKMDTEAKAKEEKKEEKAESEKKDDSQSPRALKGVMRVGVLAKGLLLHGDLHVHLVVLCAEKPTRTLLVRVKDNLPKQLAKLKGGEGSSESKSFMVHSAMFEAKQTKNKPPTVTEDKYDVQLKVEDAAIIVTSDKEPKTSCTITLTSPIMREENVAGEGDKVKDPPDVLDRQKCLNALAALRHAKWFQARANGLQSCVVVIRILRDLCQRVPTWAPLNEWAMELLVEKCVGSGGNNMSPGDALRRVFECMSSGILLPGGPGLYDPCEKESTDAAASLSGQEREDITASAQHALRLMAFRQIHKVLGMDPLPAPKFQRNRFNSRKRRRTTSTGDGGDSEAGDGKKDKKDEDAMETAEAN